MVTFKNRKHLQSAYYGSGHENKDFARIVLFKPHKSPSGMDTIIIFILHLIQKLKISKCVFI